MKRKLVVATSCGLPPCRSRLILWAACASASKSQLLVLLLCVFMFHATLVHMAFVSPPGTIIAFGSNTDGRASPPATAANKIVAVSAGGFHTLALTAHGRVICFGSNSNGQCNTGNLPTTIVAISAGFMHSLALDSTGRVWAFGSDSYGESVVSFDAMSDVVAIAAGYGMSMALKASGTVVAWGHNVDNAATDASALTGIASLGGGGYFYLAAVTTAGATVVVGRFATQGTGAANWTLPAGSQSGVTAISASTEHLLMLKSTGQVLVAAAPAFDISAMPTAAQSGIVAIDAGYVHSLALTSQGTVLAWLWSTQSNVAPDTGQASVPAAAQSGIAAVSAGVYHSAVIKGMQTNVEHVLPMSPWFVNISQQRCHAPVHMPAPFDRH